MIRLLESLATTEALAEVFSDGALLRGMLRFEAALMRAQGDAGLVPATVADAVAAVPLEAFELAALAQSARTSGTIAVAFVSMLADHVEAALPGAGRLVHHGATSQDVTDTALVLCLQRAGAILAHDHERLTMALRTLSDAHRDTVMLGRTLMQPAAPITFGLKAAGWFAGVARSRVAVAAAFEGCRALQFGGPVGTLAAFDTGGPAIAERVAALLGLVWPGAPWHAQRERFATLVTACAVYTGALAKIARDVSLLMQFELSEVSEPGGGSSSMPHKKNPAGCARILAAANRVPALTAALLAGLAQEHERGVGGWHAEALTIAEVVQGTGSALAAAADLTEQLTVNGDRMRANLEALRGTVFAATDRTRAPEDELGAAETFRRRLLDDA